ncbi:MAG: FAD-dependent thymidylate synthase [Candidatus Bathyarchaeota archaeon]|nr:FAD-dependent thymidylate synthase [Candidatus Bathyarchaeota archaeon]MDH5787010.1 FAD-dependent thymidylate synthase [Candidatus Bathyarchaeota archaeon]
MKVKLLRHTTDPELLCGAAALTSTKIGRPSEILENIDSETAKRIIKRVTGYEHVSVIEHASFTFSIEGVSRTMTHQLVRHRVASYTQQSQRYVTYDTPEKYVTPPSITKNTRVKEIFDDALEKISETYQKLLKAGIPKEDARFILPNAAKTNIIVTMNARELQHFCNLRCCARAQWEIREVATEMLKQAKKAAPALFENAGPACILRGYCAEGKMKPPECNIEELRKRFRNL